MTLLALLPLKDVNTPRFWDHVGSNIAGGHFYLMLLNNLQFLVYCREQYVFVCKYSYLL